VQDASRTAGKALHTSMMMGHSRKAKRPLPDMSDDSHKENARSRLTNRSVDTKKTQCTCTGCTTLMEHLGQLVVLLERSEKVQCKLVEEQRENNHRATKSMNALLSILCEGLLGGAT
jgi:hypothetical protein